jgi:hypothetical protein
VNWRVVWSDEAERALLQLPADEADHIFAAVERMAATDRGFVRKMLDGSNTLGLYVGRQIVLFARDPDRTIRVLKLKART